MKSIVCILTISVLVLLQAFSLSSGQTDGRVVINELMADNDSAVEGPWMTFPDWIELYNSGSESADLSNMFLTDNLGSSAWKFPDGTVIGPNSFLVVWADKNAGQGTLHSNFSLSAGGGTLVLLAEDKKTVLDLVLFDKQIRDVSYGRLPDGGSNWNYLTVPTAGEANTENPQTGISTNWAVWAFIAAFLIACVLFVLRGKIGGRRKLDG